MQINSTKNKKQTMGRRHYLNNGTARSKSETAGKTPSLLHKKRAVAKKQQPFSCFLRYAQSLISMASLGQASLQAPQLTQSSFLTVATPSTTLMASTGHSPSQEPQPTHFSLSTSAGMVFSNVFSVLCPTADRAATPSGNSTI